jgi:small multidrug resistance pump
MGYIYMSIAIVAEVLATTALKSSEGFTRLWPTVFVFIGYSVAFYMLSKTLETLSMGITYAIWSGVGIVFITFAGWLLHNQTIDAAAMVGMGLIVAGVAVIQLFSNATAA